MKLLMNVLRIFVQQAYTGIYLRTSALRRARLTPMMVT